MSRNLNRWRLSASAFALHLAEGRPSLWEDLAPRTQSGGSRGWYDPAAGVYDYRTPALPRAERPVMLTIRVQGVSGLGIPEHTLILGGQDYQSALKRMSDEERSAWDTYLGTTRPSAFYAVQTAVRKRVEDGVVSMTRVYAHLVKGEALRAPRERDLERMRETRSKGEVKAEREALERAAKKVLDGCTPAPADLTAPDVSVIAEVLGQAA